MSSSHAPEPSPAPTLAGVPGYFPPTPDTSSAHDANPLEADTPPDHGTDYAHKVNNVVGAAVAGTLGLVVGGPAAAVIAGGIVGLVESENDKLKSRAADPSAAHDATATASTSTSEVEPAQAFDLQQQNSQSALHESPAQRLVSPETDDEGARLTGAGALGGALLAGASGAKVAENEISEPREDESLTPTATRHELPVQPEEPDFGTPAIEKEQAELAHSPAQRLLGERSESTVGAENILLAGGTGAVIADREIEEPELELPKTGETVATVAPSVSSPDQAVSEPLNRSVSSVPNPAPETPRPTATTQQSTSSFAAAVLAAGTGIDTPTREEVPLSMTGSTGIHPLVQASDLPVNNDTSREIGRSDDSSRPESSIHTHPNIFPVFEAAKKDTSVSSEPEIGAGLAHVADDASPSGPASEDVVHNPPPQTLDALVPVSEATEPEAERPRDFQPYTPPEHESEPAYQDKGKGKAKELEAVTAGAGTGAGAAILAHELREKRSIDSSDDQPSSQPGSIFQENFTPQPQIHEYNPLAIENQRAIPPQQAQGDPVLVLPVTADIKGKGKAIDPEELQKVPSTTLEQAGFAPGASNTVAAQEFAHLSEPAPEAELAAQAENPQAPRGPVQASNGEESKSSVAPLVVPAVAGLATGAAAPLAVNNNATSANLSQAPANSTGPIQQPSGSQQAVVVPQQQQTPLAQQAVSPVGQQQAQPSGFNAAAAPVQPRPEIPTQARPDAGMVSPAPAQPPVGRSNSPAGLTEGVERSPHMHIQTHADESGHKKLHRKSLAADTVPLKFGVGVTKASKPDKSSQNEARRQKMMDGLSGVPDPTTRSSAPTTFSHVPPAQQQDVYYQQNPAAQPSQPLARAQPGVQFERRQPVSAPRGATVGHETAQPVRAAPNRLAAVTPQGDATPPPVGSAAQVPGQPQGPLRTSAPSSPVSPAGPNNNGNVHRKLSKSRPRRKSNASAGSDKGGFLGKVFGRHSRSASGSVDGGSNRGSVELQRPAPQ